MPRLLLVRHGQTTWNAENRFQGQSDSPLSELGRRQAAAVGQRLGSYPMDEIWSSDLSRALHTAEAIARHHGLLVRLDARLREFRMGEWEGLTGAEIAARDPERLALWRHVGAHVSAPGGESLTDLAERLRPLLEEMRRLPDDAHIVLVSHGGAIRGLVCLALGLPPEMNRHLVTAETSLTEIELRDGRTILLRLNDHAHLEAAAFTAAT